MATKIPARGIDETYEQWLERYKNRVKPRHSGPQRIEKDGKFFRMRRGKLVEIPPEWVGQVTHPQTMRKRDSKQPKREPSRQTKLQNRVFKEPIE